MDIVLGVLALNYIGGFTLNLALIIVLIIEEFVLYHMGVYTDSDKLETREKLQNLFQAIIIIFSSWGFWLTNRSTLNDFYIMKRGWKMFLKIVKIIFSIIFGAGTMFFTAFLIDKMTINMSSGTGVILIGLFFLIFLIIDFLFFIGLV